MVKIESFGRDAFLIVSDTGLRVITDPYDPSIGHGDVAEQADVVTVSHEHKDHNYVSGVKGNPLVVKGPGLHEAKGVEFTGLDTFHDKSQGSERGHNTVFSFELDGIKVCHLGDLGHLLSDEQVAAMGKVDLLFCPVGGTVILDATEATELVRRVKPRVVIPMHYRTERSGPRFAAVDEFLANKTGVRQLASSTFETSRTNLPHETQIVVLQHSR